VPADQGSDVRTGRAIDWPIDGAIMTVEEAVEVTGRTPHPIHVIDRHVGVLIYEDGGSWDARRGPMAAARRRLTLIEMLTAAAGAATTSTGQGVP